MGVQTIEKPRPQDPHPGGAPQAPPPLPSAEPKSSYWWIWVLIIVAIVGVLAYVVVARLRANAADTSASARRGGGAPMPVVTGKVHTGDLPVYLDGLLGTVTPYLSTTVRSRVDGQIMNIYFTEGQTVHEGDVLAQIDPRPYEDQLGQAQGQLAKDEASLKNAQTDLARYQAAGQAVTNQQLQTAAATVNQLEGQVKSDNANIQTAQLQVTYSKITAPITGKIGLRLVDPGNIVHASDQNGIAVINQVQPITVVFPIPQDQIGQVLREPNGGKGLVVEAYGEDPDHKIAAGSVEALDNQVDPTTGTVKVKATFANQDDALYPGLFVNVRLLLNTLHNVVLVPQAAVQLGPDSQYVYVVKADDTVSVQNIKTGQTTGDQTVVTSGLAPGDVVVTDGVDKLNDGSKVTTRQGGAATRPSGAGGPPPPGATPGRGKRNKGAGAAGGAGASGAAPATRGAGE